LVESDRRHRTNRHFWPKLIAMEHRGVRYAIRIGIERERWRVAIHPPGNVLPEERMVFGTREDAEITARSMIDAWLRKRRRQDFDAGAK